MNILWLTWKDREHPLAGGAELINEELAKRLERDGHQVIFLVAGFKDGEKEEKKNGFKIIRLGNRWSVYWKAFRYYKKNLVGWPSMVIDEVNTIPFFTKFYVKERTILFVHQLCREIWFHEMFFPLNILGFAIEPLYLWLLRDQSVITVSQSTKRDLMRYGFKKKEIHIISEGIDIEWTKDLEQIKKYERPTILSLGSIRSMKRTDHIIRAFELAKNTETNLRLILAGDTKSVYGRRVLKMINESPYKDSITYLGRVTNEKKRELMRRSHVLCVASVKEGWGLVVTEANSQGTPAIVYGVDGLRDAVRNNETGLICERNTPEIMAKNILELLHDSKKYKKFQNNAHQWSKQVNIEQGYKDLLDRIHIV